LTEQKVLNLHEEWSKGQPEMGIIKTPDEKYYFTITINPNLREEENADAMVSPIYKLDVGSSEVIKVVPGRIGHIQFKDETCFTSGVIAHEATHCATNYMRLFEPDKFKLDEESCDDNEERLAWLIGWFTKELANYFYEKITPKPEGIIEEIDPDNLKIGNVLVLASRKYEIRWVEKCYNKGVQVAARNHPMERWIEIGMDLPPDEVFHCFWHEVEHLINHLIGLRNGPPVSVDDEQLLEAKEHYQVQALKQVIEWQFGGME